MDANVIAKAMAGAQQQVDKRQQLNVLKPADELGSYASR